MWIQRDGSNKICGAFSQQQVGRADEQIADNAPELLAFLNPPPDPRKAAFAADLTRQDLIDRLATATPAQINSYVDANVTTLAEARTLFKRILLVMVKTNGA